MRNFILALGAITLTACSGGGYHIPCSNCESVQDTGSPVDETEIDDTDTDTETETEPTGRVDADGDGYLAQNSDGDIIDCNDADATIHPGAEDATCDGVDQNCDGIDGIPPEFRSGESDCGSVDEDGDGFMNVDGDGNIVDCNDADATIHPGATEVEDDGIDQDCDGEDAMSEPTDTGDTDVDPDDADGDGYDSVAAGGDDCDDEDPTIHPGATEVPYDDIDQDCTGHDLVDVDCDGVAKYDAAGNILDCDDEDPLVYPGATEIPDNGIDDDCTGGDEVTESEDTSDTAEPVEDTDEPVDTGTEPIVIDSDVATCDDGDGVISDMERACLIDLDGDGEDDAFLISELQAREDETVPMEVLDFTFGGGCIDDGEELVLNSVGYYVMDFSEIGGDCDQQFNLIQVPAWARIDQVCEESREFCDLQDNGTSWEEWNFSLSWDPDDGGLVGTGNGFVENCQLDEDC